MFLEIHTANDLHLNIKDVAWLVGLLVSFGTAWFKLKLENAKQNEKIKALEQRATEYYAECKNEFDNAKKGRVSIRRDFEMNLKANNEVFSGKIEKIDNSMSDIQKNINEINITLSAINTQLNIGKK